MPRKGRKKKPTKLKALQGNPGHRPLPAHEAEPPGKVKRPYGLKTHEPEIAKIWDKWAPSLLAVGLLTAADIPAFLFMAQHYWIANYAVGRAKAEGLTRYDENHVERKHPLLQVWRDNSAAFRQWCTEFGMTPSSRAGLTVPEPEMPTIADALFEMVNKAK